MTRYSPERKEAVLRKVLPPQLRPVVEVANAEVYWYRGINDFPR